MSAARADVASPALSDAPSETSAGRPSDAADDLVPVRLLGLPVAVHERAQEHSDGLQREFRLVVEQVRSGDDVSAPRRLLDLVRTVSAQYGGHGEVVEQLVDEALAEGRATLDEVVLLVPSGVTDAVVDLGRAFDEADAWCRQGQHLLTLATPPDLVRYRRWYLSQFTEQVAGRPPTAWADYTG